MADIFRKRYLERSIKELIQMESEIKMSEEKLDFLSSDSKTLNYRKIEPVLFTEIS